MKLARDLMTENPLCVCLKDDIHKLTEIFLEMGIKSIPVIDENKVVLGVFTDYNLVRATIQLHYRQVGGGKVEGFLKYLEKPVLVDEKELISDVVKKLYSAPNKRIFVTQQISDRLIGVISPLDLLQFLNGEKSSFKQMHEEITKMGREVRRLTHDLEEAEENINVYEDIYENAPYMMHSVDSEGIIIMANKKLHKTLGYKDGGLVGRPMFDLYPQREHNECIEGLNVLKKRGSHQLIYTALVKKDKSLVNVDLSSSVVKDDDGKFLFTLTVTRELEHEQLKKALGGLVNLENLAKQS